MKKKSTNHDKCFASRKGLVSNRTRRHESGCTNASREKKKVVSKLSKFRTVKLMEALCFLQGPWEEEEEEEEKEGNDNYDSMYIESLKDVVTATDFEKHVQFLSSVREGQFNAFVEHLGDNVFVERLGDKTTALQFTTYVKKVRDGTISNDKLAEHITKLRYTVYDHYTNNSNKEKYRVIFWDLKKMFWCLTKICLPVVRSTVVLYHARLSDITDNDTLEDALRVACSLDDNLSDCLQSLKPQLRTYHPDKNPHPLAAQVFDKLQKPYTALSLLSSCATRQFGDDSFCDIKEFLSWKLTDFTEINIMDGFSSTSTMYGTALRHRMLDFKANKHQVDLVVDELLTNYRDLMHNHRAIFFKFRLQGLNKYFCINQEEYHGGGDIYKDTMATIRDTVAHILINIVKVKNKLEVAVTRLFETCKKLKDEIKINQNHLKSLLSKTEDNSEIYRIKQKLYTLFSKLESASIEQDHGYCFLPLTKKLKVVWTNETERFNLKESKYGFITKYEELREDFLKLHEEVSTLWFKVIKNDEFKYYKFYSPTEVSIKKKEEKLNNRINELTNKYPLTNESSDDPIIDIKKENRLVKASSEKEEFLKEKLSQVEAKTAQALKAAEKEREARLVATMRTRYFACQSTAFEIVSEEAEDRNLTRKALKEIEAFDYLRDLFNNKLVYEKYEQDFSILLNRTESEEENEKFQEAAQELLELFYLQKEQMETEEIKSFDDKKVNELVHDAIKLKSKALKKADKQSKALQQKINKLNGESQSYVWV